MCLIAHQTAAVPKEPQKWSFVCKFTITVLICPRYLEEGVTASLGSLQGVVGLFPGPLGEADGSFQCENKRMQT